MPTVSISPVSLTSNEIITLCIAAYAAIISTFVLGWDAYKWLASGAKVDLSVSANMYLVGNGVRDTNPYITITALNIGDLPTTITNLGGVYFDTWWSAYITRRKKQAFIITNPSQAQPIPYRFEVGAQWVGMTMQTAALTSMASSGYLFLILYTATGGRGQRVRLRIKQRATSPGSPGVS